MWKKLLSALGFITMLIAGAIGGSIGKLVGKAAFSPSQSTPQQI